METYFAGAEVQHGIKPIPPFGTSKDVELRVDSVGFRRYLPEDSKLNYKNEEMEDPVLFYIQKGSLSVQTREQQKICIAGTMILFLPDQQQSGSKNGALFPSYSYTGQEFTELYWVHFSGTKYKEALSQHLFDSRLTYNVSFDNSYALLFEKMISVLNIKEPFFHLAAKAYFLELLYMFAQTHYKRSANCQPKPNPNLQRAVDTMHTEYAVNRPVSYYAGLCHLSTGRFITNFKKSYLLSPMEYLRNIRVNKARELLRDTSDSVNEIARQVGYDNPLYFSRVFKQVAGISPKFYRNNIITNEEKGRMV